ncbi:hypothetical protein DICPUDRAFT_80734 [Dictyostelium purpureum]|uniref:Uncharacterized protein n=1 Tax=Dictyostelium purpureum TaxID=5786 RepID=F0ZRD2_DICPU|nr:uncharacterized protein DICPUDRAFT_80734 [Dictyostelium purpureum]EGC33506.1 hypothetical protein DICPUDRAFT_80734 [Dictyostelium purpureum]|eukprot:XP_003289980.1 hypothetical protein DICPUDRAFT_80734 [Dictyostelium purpureum]
MKLIFTFYFFLIYFNFFYHCSSKQLNYYSLSNEGRPYPQPREWKTINSNDGYSSVDLIKFQSYPNQVEEFRLEINEDLYYKDININIASHDPKVQSKIKLEFGENKYITGKTPWLVQVCGVESINFNITCINKMENEPCSLTILINSTSTIDLCSNGVEFNYVAILNDWFDSLVKTGDVIYYILEKFIPITK